MTDSSLEERKALFRSSMHSHTSTSDGVGGSNHLPTSLTNSGSGGMIAATPQASVPSVLTTMTNSATAVAAADSVEATPKLSNTAASSNNTTPNRSKKPFRESLANVGRRLKGRFNKGGKNKDDSLNDSTNGADDAAGLSNNYGSIMQQQQQDKSNRWQINGIPQHHHHHSSSAPGKTGHSSSQQPSASTTAATSLTPRNHRNHPLLDNHNNRRQGRTLPHGDGHGTRRSNGNESTVIRKFETLLRWLVLLGAAFFIGTCVPSNRAMARSTLQYLVVAWGTALVLLLAVHCDSKACQRRRQDDDNALHNDDADFVNMEEGFPLLGMNHHQQQPPRASPPGVVYHDYHADETDGARCLDLMDHGMMMNIDNPPRHQRQPSAASSAFQSSVGTNASSVAGAAAPPTPPKTTRTTVLPHPSLHKLHVTDAKENRRANLNSPQHLHIMDNEFFTGHMMILIRTPDVDDEPSSSSYPDNAAAVEYLRGKQRRFEFQFQGRLKKIPTGRLYFSCELEQSIKLGMLQRAFVGAAMAFVKSTNPFFHYSITGDPATGEPPHMAFPFFAGMNRVVATPPGQAPPPLGVAIEEPKEDEKNRYKGKAPFEWNTQDTYTFAIWSAYADFLSWRVLNLPGIRPFALQSVLGLQPIQITVYEMDEDPNDASHGGNINNNKVPHIRDENRTLVRLELCNSEVMPDLGPAARQAMEAQKVEQREQVENQSGLMVATTASQTTTTAITTEHDDDEEDGYDATIEGSTHIPSDGELGTSALNMSAILEYDEEASTAEEEAAAGELGEGIYIRSGDSIVLKEMLSDTVANKNDPVGFMSIGGGFCVVQEQPQQLCTLVIEKIRSRSKQSMTVSQHGSSSLIKSGDTVRFKLIKGDGTMLYLTIHRGWWLKWVNTESMKNGHFTIKTLESEYPGEDDDGRQHQSQSSYLTVGGSFWLQHKKWAKFAVGVGTQESATYGGRMMGLYRNKDANGSVIPNGTPSSSLTEGNASDPALSSPALDDEDVDPNNSKAPEEWMKPITFRVFEGGSTLSNVASELTLRSADPLDMNEKPDSNSSKSTKLRFSKEDARADVPVWIESLNRTERVRHLAFIVRVVPPKNKAEAFVRIRTGRDLADVMRVGLNWRNSSGSSPARPNHTRQASRNRLPSFGDILPPPAIVSSPNREEMNGSVSTGSPRNEDVSLEEDRESEDKDSEGYDDLDAENEEEYEDEGDDVDDLNVPTSPTSPSRKRDRPRRRIGKFARNVKNRTFKAGKGTVSAGKSIIPIRSKNPPMKEPNQKVTARSRRRTERELHVAVSRGVKQLEKQLDRNEANTSIIESPSSTVLAGELSAPERSCRSVSTMLTKMSSVPRISEHCSSFSELLNSKLSQAWDHDETFLQGKAIDLGVVPNSGAICGAVVAVCKWEGHWREEWCGLYERTITFYAPLTNTSCFELSLADIQSFRLLDMEEGRNNPLPGLPILVLETAWQCHYLAFADDEARQNFHDKLNEAKAAFEKGALERQSEMDLWKARFWQGFRSSFEASLFGGKGKWAEIASGRAKKRRVVLNKRRMSFDLDTFPIQVCAFSKELLSKSLSFRLESLLEHPEALGGFLDATSQLQNMPIRELDFTDAETFCTFVNLYHCLLQHALLLTVNGPLTIRSCGHFMRTSCYEIGGDVFSLAELYLCVIRGRMARPVSPKPPFFDVPKKSLLAYQYYSLGYTSNRVNFVLNTGNVSSPRHIPIFTPELVDSQLTQAATTYCRQNIVLDERKRVVYLPRIFDVFRGDFSPEAGGGSAQACLRFCLAFLDPPLATKIQSLTQEGGSSLAVKFQQNMSDQYHSTLKALIPTPVSSEITDEDEDRPVV